MARHSCGGQHTNWVHDARYKSVRSKYEAWPFPTFAINLNIILPYLKRFCKGKGGEPWIFVVMHRETENTEKKLVKMKGFHSMVWE